jgi:hypothetical protein
VIKRPMMSPRATLNKRRVECGFTPMEEPVESEKKKRAREESEESKALKKEILKLVARYPKLELRTSKEIMDKLNEMGEDELRIIRDNCVNDLAEMRGTPVASFVVFLITQPVDWKLPGYTDQCLSDIELKRDVETELIMLLGDLSNRINIFFRLLNNAYITWKKSRSDNYSFEYNASRAEQEPNSETNRASGREEEDTAKADRTGESPWARNRQL